MDHRYLMSRWSLQVFYLWRHVLSTAPPFVLWWSNLEILFAPPPPQLSLHRKTELSSNSNRTRSVYSRKNPKKQSILWNAYGLDIRRAKPGFRLGILDLKRGRINRTTCYPVHPLTTLYFLTFEQFYASRKGATDLTIIYSSVEKIYIPLTSIGCLW
jgi:hypothetical protein